MILYTKMKTLGSGKVGSRIVPNIDSITAIRLEFISDARLFYKVFGRDRARQVMKDTVYSTTQL